MGRDNTSKRKPKAHQRITVCLNPVEIMPQKQHQSQSVLHRQEDGEEDEAMDAAAATASQVAHGAVPGLEDSFVLCCSVKNLGVQVIFFAGLVGEEFFFQKFACVS